MVTVPRLEDFSAEELAQARALSPAFARYSQLLSDPHIDPLHAQRHRAWCEVVASTFFGKASTEDLCLFWSETADRLLQQVWQECGLDEHEAVLFALGKQGAQELNLSSDIDLLIVAEPREVIHVEKGLRRFQTRLQQNGPHGFCFRLDFDLRPGGKMGPMITSPSQFQDYYWSQGETWERLALVRLRHIAGANSLKQQIEDLARRFSYRKFLDFTLLDDLKALRSKVHQTGFDRRENELHLKLEVGMIRDIELFVHSLLILNGGKILDLQTRSTPQAIAKLSANQLLSASDAKILNECYWRYRHAENIVQALEDRQTHAYTKSLPLVPGLPDRAELESRRQQIDVIVSALLGKVDLSHVSLPSEELAQRSWLDALGFGELSVNEVWPRLASATALSHKNDRDERARQEFLFSFINALAKHPERDLGLSLLVDFVKATRAKASFFTMLLHSPKLIHDLARLFCLSPYLGHILASRPELLEHFILQVDDEWSPEVDVMLNQMAERKLMTEIWAANQFLSDHDLAPLYSRITGTADDVCTQMLKQLKSEFSGSTVELLALGKWGGYELGLRSDLDFIFVTPGRPVESDFKVAKRFISRLTDPLKGGNLYEVDLRLRPSGQSGPLLVGHEQLVRYWRESAQPWERQAYLRARLVGQAFSVDKSDLIQKPLSIADLEELQRIRAKLLKPISENKLDLKYAPGGLLDLEFVAQTAILQKQLSGSPASTGEMVQFLSSHDPKWRLYAKPLHKAYSRMRQWEQGFQLATAFKVSETGPDKPAFVKAAQLFGEGPETAWEEITHLLANSGRILNELDPTGYNSRS